MELKNRDSNVLRHAVAAAVGHQLIGANHISEDTPKRKT
jgi:hypothetical protein